MKFTLREAAPGRNKEISSVECDEAGNVSSDKPELALDEVDVSKLSGEQGKAFFYYLLSRAVTGHYTAVETDGVDPKYQMPSDFDPFELPSKGGEETKTETEPETENDTDVTVDTPNPVGKPEIPKLPARLKRRDG